MKNPVLDEPVIVLTAGRSGSTLLRLILDSHPDLACPPETNIVKICAQLASVWHITNGRTPAEELPAAVHDLIHATVANLYGDYLIRQGKLRWCDKSIGTASAAHQFAALYPKAKFICLYRHCMDVMDSGLEASPWGLVGYGFDQFSGAGSGNSVSALAAYWIEHTGQIMSFEEAHRDRCVRVHYERLVADPEKTVEEIFSFLDVRSAPEVTKEWLTRTGQPIGPGDHKIAATHEIGVESVGRGARIPVGMIPAAQLTVINHLLGELGYTQVDDAWRRSVCPPALLPDDGSAGWTGRRSDLIDDTVTRSVLDSVGGVIRDRVGAGLAEESGADRRTEQDDRTFAIVAYNSGRSRSAQAWYIDPASRSIVALDTEDSEQLTADWAVTGDVNTWLGVLGGRTNMATCVRAGRLRYVNLGANQGLDESGEAWQFEMDRRIGRVRRLLGLGASG